MRPNVQTQIQRTDGVRKERMPMAGETDHPLYHAFAMPAGETRFLTKGQALVLAGIIDALSGMTGTITDNGDGTFTHTFSASV